MRSYRALWIFSLAFALLPWNAAATDPCLEVTATQSLPSPVEWAKDVRWLANDRLLITTPILGTFEVDPSGANAANLIIPKASDSLGPATLAASEAYFVIGAPVGSYLEIRREGVHKTSSTQQMDFLADVDLIGTRLALTGAQRGPFEYAPDGAIAWLDQVGTAPEKMRPLFYSESGPGALNMARCGLLGLSAIRFLRDGSLVFVPGVEGGVYQYAVDGRLKQTWTAEKVGFDSGCPVSEAEFRGLAFLEHDRFDWINQRRVVEDIIPTQDGPGILIRQFKNNTPSWELKVLRPDGTIRSCPVPVTTTAQWSRIKADVFQDQIGILLFENGYFPHKGRKTDPKTGKVTEIPQVLHPSQPPRWVRLKYNP